MSDTFLPGSGFDTYEEQDKVLVGLCGGRGCRAAVRILQQQGFAVAGAVVRLTDADDTVQAAKDAAKALGIECVTLNASELASQLAEEALPCSCCWLSCSMSSLSLPPGLSSTSGTMPSRCCMKGWISSPRERTPPNAAGPRS